MHFEDLDLDAAILEGIKALGYQKPTTIQQQAIPVALDGRDLLASAPTGTGKTAAYLLPALQHLIDFPRKKPGFARVLIMTPTRELAYQTYEQAKSLAQFTELSLGVITGGINYGSHHEVLNKNNDLLIATPGRLMEYLENETFNPLDVELLILDEADRMLDMGFLKEMDRIAAETKRRKHTWLYSATLEGASLIKFARQIMPDPAEVYASPPRREKQKIQQWIHLADDYDHKFKLLVHWLKQEETQKSIVFVKTRERLQTLIGQLQSEGLKTCWLQGEMPQHKRNQAIEAFHQNKVSILVATDVAARGIDVDDVTHVINFDMPRKADVYLHRIGRTGRAGKKGNALSLVEAHDMEILSKVERYTDQKLARRVIESLKPKHKAAKVPVKKKKKKVNAATPAKKQKKQKKPKKK